MFLRLLTAFFAFSLMPAACLLAQTAGIDSTAVPLISDGPANPADPNTWFGDEAFITSIQAALTLLLSLFAGKFPGLSKIPTAWLRTVVVALAVVAISITGGWQSFDGNIIKYLLNTFLTGSVAGFAYEGLKFLLGLFGVKFSSLKPSAG